MRVTIFGTGYVGLVTGACLADVGHNVMCMDIDRARIESLQRGEIPIYEPGLGGIVKRNADSGSLSFTCDTARAVSHAEVQIIAVGTPPDETGAADLQHVLAVAENIGREMDSSKVVVVKSTVPVGTCEKVAQRIEAVLKRRGVNLGFDVASNPEFLKEGAAVADFQRPDRIIVGVASAQTRATMAELYHPFNRNHERTIYMDVRSAELTKYAANAMLATRISFINEIAQIAEHLGADIEQVRRGIGSDPRIGYDFIYAGLGYGGSCFPKDVRALIRTARGLGCDTALIEAVERINEGQRSGFLARMAAHYGGPDRLRGKTFALWGLSFKPNTDDIREAPARSVIEALWAAGAKVRLFDPVAHTNAIRLYGARPDLTLASDKYAALDGADALVLCTEWREFRAPDFREMAARMPSRTIFDGRNLYEPERMRAEGWTYYSIGRPAITGASEWSLPVALSA
jgi:UDPglucose 6-dehydrogenase